LDVYPLGGRSADLMQAQFSGQRASVDFCLEAAEEIVTSVEQTLELEPGALGHGYRAAATFTATIVLFIDMCHQADRQGILRAEERVSRGLRLLR
jgi:hypothetical protein